MSTTPGSGDADGEDDAATGSRAEHGDDHGPDDRRRELPGDGPDDDSSDDARDDDSPEDDFRDDDLDDDSGDDDLDDRPAGDHGQRLRPTATAGPLSPLTSRVGRFRQSAAELRQSLAGEASARAASSKLRERGLDESEPSTFLESDEPGTPTDVPPDLTAAAFFDVDNTLVQGASIVHFARGLAARDYFSYRDVMEFVWAQAKFRMTGRENSEDVAQGREKALSFIAGRETDELVRLGEEIFDEFIADKIWPGTRTLAQMHLDAGQQVWLVTATPVELAQTIADRLGLTGALGTVAESVDGVFTGRLVGDILHGLGKAHAVRTLAIREGLNLKRCTAYSDSHNDVPMLSLVGTAVAINPDADLREVARVRGWEIRDYRTARKAAKIGVPTAVLLGAAGGGAAAAVRHLRR
ncbi:HAD superfamily hydrolase (TIGR01490 family) [Williamsia muralis]|uniref:HAD superfamily hydrolase (TIGR01490 family) n=1 Tax=Williamsia marianensis TaxID=85044 RepID=A0A495K0U2_WILMA|nr:HAD superfamily hydrolase (TIGR01490 family) [Williamsia muralis]